MPVFSEESDGRMSWGSTAVLVSIKGITVYRLKGNFSGINEKGKMTGSDEQGKHLMLIEKTPRRNGFID
jgi:hypothetical protein